MVIETTNFDKDLDLTLLENSDIGQLVDTLQNCSAVESVDISCPNNGRTHQVPWNAPVVQRLFETIGSLPKLRKVQCKFLGGGDQDNPIPLSLFTALLLNAASRGPRLESFRLILVGPIISSAAGEQDSVDFSRALGRQERLRDVRLGCCYLSHESLLLPSHSSFSFIDPVLRALSALPCLKTVHVKAANRGHLGRLPADSMGALCHNSTSLRNLCLDNFVLDHSHVAVVSKALATNATTLEDLYLNLSGVTPLDPTLLPAALATNQRLRRLQLRLTPQKSVDDFLRNTATALRDNASLREFGLHGGIRIQKDIEQAFCEMLDESNCVLESLVMPSSYTGGWRETIDMLLRFNGRGRQRLLQQSASIPRDEWMPLFANNDLNFVYYYMRVIGHLLCKEGLNE